MFRLTTFSSTFTNFFVFFLNVHYNCGTQTRADNASLTKRAEERAFQQPAAVVPRKSFVVVNRLILALRLKVLNPRLT